MASITDVSSREELLKNFAKLTDDELKKVLGALMLIDESSDLSRPAMLEFLGKCFNFSSVMECTADPTHHRLAAQMLIFWQFPSTSFAHHRWRNWILCLCSLMRSFYGMKTWSLSVDITENLSLLCQNWTCNSWPSTITFCDRYAIVLVSLLNVYTSGNILFNWIRVADNHLCFALV